MVFYKLDENYYLVTYPGIKVVISKSPADSICHLKIDLVYELHSYKINGSLIR